MIDENGTNFCGIKEMMLIRLRCVQWQSLLSKINNKCLDEITNLFPDIAGWVACLDARKYYIFPADLVAQM